MSGLVRAYWIERTVHIFPTDVASVGWLGAENALREDMAPRALFDDFTTDTAASLVLEAEEGVQDEVLPETPEPVVDEAPVFPPLTPNPEPPPSDYFDPELPLPLLVPFLGAEGEAILKEIASSSEAVLEGATTTPTEAETPAPSPIQPVESEPVETATSSPSLDVASSSATTTGARNSQSHAFLQRLRSLIGTTVFATTTDTSTPSGVVSTNSVAACITLGTPCYTMRFSGFGVSGDLREKVFKEARVGFSFASRIPENTDNTLVVRYLVDGQWRESGEVYLAGDISNDSNGGYFSAPLEGLSSWNDLASLEVEIEFVRGDTRIPAEIYLDGLWLDTTYRERAQDVLRGEVGDPTVPENVSFTLASARERALSLPDGSQITFAYTDDLDDALFMRADRASYATRRGGSETVVHASITNTGETEEDFALSLALPDGAVRVEQFVRNIASTTEVVIEEDVTYFCETGWDRVRGDRYRCVATEEEHVCSWLNSTRENCLVSDEAVGVHQDVRYYSGWVALETLNERRASARELPPGYAVLADTRKNLTILPGQTLFFRFTIDRAGARPVILAEGSASGDLDTTGLGSERRLRAQAERAERVEQALNEHLSKTEFEADELPTFDFKYNTQRSAPLRFLDRVLGRDSSFTVRAAKLVHESGERIDLPMQAVLGKDGEWRLDFTALPREFKAGRYTLDIQIEEGGRTFGDTVEFFWGILALNTDQSSYMPGEEANLMMAVLDEIGNTVCDADLELSITTPRGEVHDVDIAFSPECGFNNVVEVADYSGLYIPDEEGVYGIELSYYDEDGALAHRLNDSFSVVSSAPFTIRRTGAMRIYPVAEYAMEIEVTAAADFNGEFIESIPESFLVETDAEVRMYGDSKNLVWPLSLKAGESARFRYVYDAPDISPYLYLLGPAEIRADTGMPFNEGRSWKIASDAVGNMLLYWDSTFIPTGWTCVSCLPSDPFYQRFVMGSSTPGVNGGAATHTHSAAGVVAATGATGVADTGGGGADAGLNTHTHTYTPVINSPSNLPPYRHLSIIQHNSTGEPSQIPAGAIAIFDAAVPSGWTRYGAQDGNYIRSEATSTIGSTGGSATHTHTITGNTTAAVGGTNASGAGATVATPTHTHPVSSSTGAVSNEPPFIEVILGKLNATSSPRNGMIAMWSGDPSVGWGTVSSTSEQFANRFLKASTTFGGTGGSATHTHTDMIGIISGTSSATVSRTTTGTSNSTGAHTHSVNVTAFSTTDHQPPFRTAVFAKRAGGATPPGPTLHDILFDNEKTGSSTPYFEFTTNDPDGTDALIYQIQWDDDADLETSPLGNRSSDNETGCSPNCFENRTTPADTSPFTEAERIRFSIQSSLTAGTTYYWRVRARESESVTWGAWATTSSFTYVPNTSPSQWFQTKDAQFDTNTLSSIETYGGDSARLSLAAPSEVLAAYGEGVVQTPRYRFWDGTVWSAEASAQNVGGTVQWIVTKGAPTRDEYVLGTQDGSADVNVQVFNGSTDTWGNLQEVTTSVASTSLRGFDIAYETQSGDAIVVYCDGDADPAYHTWNGTSWTSGGTINLGSANNCEYIKLASDPTSDEIILVARDTGVQYEAQVWNGSAWGNAKTIGSMLETPHEGIGLEYEDSGDQALVTVSNGLSNNFAWTSWNGTEWSINTTQALGDDFEWGRLRADEGTDAMALCYMDNDNDIGVVRWDGNAWSAFSERETGGNTKSGRAVDCAFETTAGRDGYIMIPYADTTNARYQVWDGTSYSAEASISTAEDSWSITTVRAENGVILSFFHDDASGRYDVSSWNGSSWSTRETFDTSPSVTVAPFLQPYDMTQKVFRSGLGTMTGTVIDFDTVPGRPSWGEVIWRTTEPSGTDVKMQVLFESGGSCSTLIPDGVIPGNSTGFDVVASPINLSSISTSTYNRICLRATLSSSNQNTPTLDEWTVSWERQSYLTQIHYRWYVNTSSLTPTDPWPSGGNDVVEDTALTTSFAPSPSDVLRLRLGLLVENVSLSSGDLALRLQYAAGATCSASLSWFDVGGVGSTTAAWRGFDNGSLSDGATIPSVLLSTSDTAETYEESNDSASNPNAVSVGNEGEWDWVLQHNAPNNTSYCFRVVTNGGEAINEYDRYAALTTNSAPGAPTAEAPFDNEAVASTSPWFQFVAEDAESDDVTYQIQIDDDFAFGSPNIDRDSQTNFDDFSNLVTPSDKDPFIPAQSVRFTPPTALVNGTTYYWRVRAKDRNRSNEWSSWSSISSVTIDTSVTISTWRETTLFQFANNTLDDTEATTTGDVVLTPPLTNGTTTGPLIDYDSKTSGNAWGELAWTDNETAGDIKYSIEYYNGTDWVLIPEADLSGNAAGFDTSPVSLLSVSPSTYNEIRVRGVFTNIGGTPRLQDWTIRWGFAVEQPTLFSLFDNEKTATVTPSFTFRSSDPQNDDLIYELSISTTPDFSASTTRNSASHAGFVNTASSTDTSPFVSNNTVRFTLQGADALTNGQTYWWRVRARDPLGANVSSVWSPLRSFTVDTSVIVSTWFETTDEQFDTNRLSDIETNGGSAQITSTIREAFAVYAEGTVQVPRFRLWNGSSWGSELSAASVGDVIRFAEAAAAPTRDEYAIGTQGATGAIDAQVVDGTTDTGGNKARLVNVVPDLTQRGFDVAYETQSGDLLAVACSGTEAVYSVWNGTSWSATSSISLSVSANCEWIKLASDPASDEIILLARDATTGASDYEALVWSGSSWGNSLVFGSQVGVNNEGIALEYEESGNQALAVVSNGANNNFVWSAWNGSSWAATSTVATGNDFSAGRLARDSGSDKLTLCYVDIDADIGYAEWTGSAWGAISEFELTGNSATGRPISCEYETTAGRDSYIMMPYSDTIQAEYVFWNGSILSSASLLTTISDATEVRTARTGDGNILAFAYDDANTEYDFSFWNGSAWSAEQVLETTSITTVTPATIPLDIVARRYPAVTSGSIETSAIAFSDGTGPKWGAITLSRTTPGASTVRVFLDYLTSTSSWAIIPDTDFPGNSVGTTTSPVDISNINRITYNTIRMRAALSCVAGNCPQLNDWTLTWSEGLNISGTAQAYDQSTNLTSGTVHVAVNGILQSGKTGTISGGTWTIPNVTFFTGDTITVFIDGAADSGEAVAITRYDGIGDITNMNLYERHVTLGSSDNQTLSNAQIGQYDNSVSADEDIFFEVDAGNDLSACVVSGCSDVELLVRSGTTYQPDSSSSGNVTTRHIEINGAITADGNSFFVSGNWDNNGVFTKNTSTVVFTATSSSATIDSTSASTSAFHNATFGQTSGNATWTFGSPLDVDNTLSIQHGTTSLGSQPLTIGGNLTIGANGVFAKGSATTTFDGTGTSIWTDSTSLKQDLGRVVIDGTSKTITLGAAAKVTDLTIGADDTFSVDNNYALEVLGNWTNNNAFLAQNGTVTFTATTTGRTITPGNSSFYNLTFNGTGGNWAFSGGVATTTNDFTITNGTVTLPTATTTIGGSFSNAATFMHNNGAVRFNASSAKTITPGSSSFFDMAFDGTGSWSFTSANATSSRHVTISNGTLTLPSGTFAVGGSFAKNGGSFAHNNGTLRLTASGAQTVRLNSSDVYTLTFAGTGSWSFVDTNATVANNLNFENGAATLPGGTLSLGGSLLATSGTFTANSGTLRLTATTTGKTINPGSSSFANVTFDSATGGWTVSSNATTTSAFTITSAASFTQASGTTLSVGGTFTNSVGGTNTTWTGATLSLVSGTSYSLNTKANTGDTYGTLSLGANTDVRMWNSSAGTTTVNATGSLYSQDHAAVDGDLYVWGEYVGSDEYWNYANDFDGTVLSGGSRRAANVRIAPSASVSIGGTLRMLGDAVASTTVANQGSGTFALSVQGTVNAQYYRVRNTDANGFGLYGTTTVTSLAQGDFELGSTGGTMLSLSQGTINQNPALQIQQVRFATSTGVSSGFNVTATGTPISYVWFRNHYGNYASEAYDSDLGGNPGFVRFDDSGFSITVSGNVYSDRGTTAIGAPCDGTTPVVKIAVGGGTYSGSCNAGSGAFSISGVEFTGDAVLTAFLDTNGGKRAVTVTKTPTGNLSGFHLYERALILRHEDVTPISVADLVSYDADNDSDVFFSAATGSPNTLVVQPENELYVWGGKTFTPGGNVTLQSGGSGDARDGRFALGASAVFTAAGSQSHSVGGGFVTESGATFTSASSTFTFTATTTGKSINAASAMSFNNLVFNGGGGWSFDGAQLTANNMFQISSGTISGTGNVVAAAGVTGNGTIAMTSGTFTLGAGSFGGSSAWIFNNLTFGSGTGSSTKAGTGTTTITNVLRIESGRTLEAGTSPWVLAGSGTPFSIAGTFTVQSAPFFYTGTTTTNIADTTYSALALAPSVGGTPSYVFMGGILSASSVTIGGANPVSLTANTNDPSITVSGNLSIGSSSTFIASNTGALQVGGSWTNSGTFTHSGGTVTFNSNDTGETISTGGSSFANVTINNAAGGWTINSNATTTSAFTLTSAASFTQASGTTLSVGGTFTNSVGGAATTWTGSTLSLVSGTSYSLNTKANTGDTYGTLSIASNTDVRMWNSSAATTNVNATGSLYSQDHAAQDGDLFIWGEYTRSTGADYWSYATDFDGTALGGSGRQVDVRVASSSSLSFTGGVLDIIGTTTASTTLAVQGSGAFSFALSGGTLSATHYELRNLDANGLALSGSPTISALADGYLELSVNGGSLMTVAGSVINANPLKTFMRVGFATSSGISSGTNVRATGTSASSWKFNLHYGSLYGESYDDDPAGDPGYLRWDDSASDITITGNVYSDEGTTVSTVCDGSTPVVRLLIEGGSPQTSSCNAGTGAFNFSSVFFNPGDTLTLYLDTNGGRKAVNVSSDPITNISDMHLYENRVIVRHEDTSPLTIASMAVYDSDNDTDIIFNATDAATDTLVLPPETKLIVWDTKTFAPAGNITLQSGGSGSAWDGSLRVKSSASLLFAGTQTHTIGGNFELDSGATFTAANSTVTFTATTTGKTINPQSSSFYNLTFNGSGGNWSFSTSTITTASDLTITNGTVTLATATTTVGGSFGNTGGTFMHNNGAVVLNATTTGKTIRANGSNFALLVASSTAGSWTFLDTNATSTSFTINAGVVTLPSGTLALGASFDAQGGTFTNAAGTLRFTSSVSNRTIRAGSSAFYNIRFDGTGSWAFLDTNVSVNDMTWVQGSTTLAVGTTTMTGSLNASAGTFNAPSGTLRLTATTTGKTINPGSSSFANVTFDSATGGWTINSNATTTSAFTLTSAASFTQASGTTLSVGGTFTNSVGGAATTWTGSTLSLVSGTSYSLNTKANTGDTYGTLSIASNTDVRMWNSSAATTNVNATGSLYSQDHAAQDGDLFIWGEYTRSTGADYWSYATDFDGTALGGSGRQVDVRVASSSSVAFSGGTLAIVGQAGATSTVRVQGTGRYAFSLAGGTLNASYYEFRNTNTSGVSISGTPTISSLSNGDFELDLTGGAMLTLAGTAIDANASLQISNVRFATSSGVSSGTNVTRTGTPVSAWTFIDSQGNFDGEAYDSDGVDDCGAVRWSDSACLFVSQEHFRWRNDDGGEGVPTSEWFNAAWSKRKRIAITNNAASAVSNLPVKIELAYDADMQADFDDLRFTDSTGTTTVPFWVESVSASATSTVWVRVPSLPASGSALVYVYYGNGSASSASDGDGTFGFFDDFEDDNISEYSGDTSTFDVDTSFNKHGSYGLDAGANVDDRTTSGIRRTGSLMAQGETIRFFQYVDASFDDEPCTYFAVQGSAQNYAVCLDQFPSDRLIIAENVTSNDGSGTVLASTTVSYTTGWYEVEVDWLSGNTIEAYVYTDSGTLFATASTTDSSYTSGGAGFGFWGQHGGWDSYMTRPYISADPSYIVGLEQSSNGATWKAAEDATLLGQAINQNIRLRFSVLNTGSPLSGQLFRLQVAPKGASLNCESVPSVNYNDVPVAGSCGSSPACMKSSSNFVDQDTTAGLLSYPANKSFVAGRMVEDSSNQSASSSVPTNAATEIEYNFELTSNAVQNSYCFRSTNGGIAFDNYAQVAEAVLLHTPQISGFTLNGANNIALTEGATTTISATGTVSDLNGFADILSSTSTFYRSGVGPQCSADFNSCYPPGETICSLSNCSGNSCTISCSASIYYFADATDAGSSFAAENWLSRVQVTDASGASDVETPIGVEMLTLFGLSLDTSGINFGSLEVGQNTGTTNATTTLRNTGNTNIDIQLSGTNLTDGSSSIAVGEQKFATTTFAYSACAICQFLTGSAANLELDLPKPTSTSTPITDELYWGINVPSGTAATLHAGTNTFIATSD